MAHSKRGTSEWYRRDAVDGFCGLPASQQLSADYLHEEEARRPNEHGYGHHHPALPLYTREDAERALGQLRAVDCYAVFEIVSASGMATGGRVLHHLRRFLPDERSAVLLVGYQSVGTRSRTLLEGADELKIHAQYVYVRARVKLLEGLSAHADSAEILAWLEESKIAPRRVFVTHGEPGAADAMRRRIRERFGWETEVPEHGESRELA